MKSMNLNFPPKLFFQITQKLLIQWQYTMSAYHWLNLFDLKDVKIVYVQLMNIEIRLKRYLQAGA